MGASCLLHGGHVFPLFVTFLEFLDGAHVVVAVEATNRVNAVCQDSRCQCSSRLIHIGKKLPFFCFGVVDFNGFQRLVVAASEPAYRIYSIILANNNSQLISWFDHGFNTLPFSSIDIKGLDSVKDVLTVISTDEVEQ